MAILSIENVKLSGLTVCVPKNIKENKDYTPIPEDRRERFIETVGIERRRVVSSGVCTSDLCYEAAENLIDKLKWDKSEIDLLVFVTQTPDYRMPSTSCVLQDRLQLPKTCMAFDVSLGCSGYIYGLSIVANLLSTGTLKKALLLVGNTQSLNTNYEDQSTYPLFGDAGSATALEFSSKRTDTFRFNLQTDGSGADSVIIPDGGFRNPINVNSFVVETFDNGIKRSRLNLKMEGDNVFSAAITQVPKAVKQMYTSFNITNENIDYFLLHEGSKFLREKLRKKMGFDADKVPSILKNYGNSSNASIPLLIVSQIAENIINHKVSLLLVAIGVGLSIGVGQLVCSEIEVADLIEYQDNE